MALLPKSILSQRKALTAPSPRSLSPAGGTRDSFSKKPVACGRDEGLLLQGAFSAGVGTVIKCKRSGVFVQNTPDLLVQKRSTINRRD
jgi:hypothetical protein